MMDDKLIDDELERRLGNLFGGPTLDLAPRPTATASVLTRVRQRRRRRRAIQVTAPALVAFAVVGAVLTSQGSSDRGAPPLPARPPTATATPTAAPTATATPTSIRQPRATTTTTPPERPASTGTTTIPPNPGELAMTANGVGALRLGMTTAQALATGLLSPSGSTMGPQYPDCRSYVARNNEMDVSVGKLGVSKISVYPFIPTPQGVGIGDPYRKAQAAYPSLPVNPDGRDTYRVRAPGGKGTWYFFDLDSTGNDLTRQTRIRTLGLTNDDPSCP